MKLEKDGNVRMGLQILIENFKQIIKNHLYSRLNVKFDKIVFGKYPLYKTIPRPSNYSIIYTFGFEYMLLRGN
ncbi:MAG: hypothetical protein EA341_13340 [Mongoliibacter sp.]|jgi:hypothetical protein|nr:MAG: hypothetical protein EA341_13340 [Mongoliibacter sp.]